MNSILKVLFVSTLIFGSGKITPSFINSLVSMLCGGTTNSVVDDKVREIVSQVRGEVEQRADESFTTFEPVEVMKQVVGNSIA